MQYELQRAVAAGIERSPVLSMVAQLGHALYPQNSNTYRSDHCLYHRASLSLACAVLRTSLAMPTLGHSMSSWSAHWQRITSHDDDDIMAFVTVPLLSL